MLKEDALKILKRFWGFDNFRPLQFDIINSVSEGSDTLGLLPTGGGKSICYQVPALSKPGLCLVISPLIALMKDQHEGLKKRGISSGYLFSGMLSREIDVALDNAIHGKQKFLFVSPERLKTDVFIERFKQMNINFISVDEAHCISQWGHDFRPPYLDIHELRNYTDAPILALTASATPQVQQDIALYLGFEKDFKLFQKSFERENIIYASLMADNKLKRLFESLEKLKGKAGIIYVRNRKATEAVAKELNRRGFQAAAYHAGLKSETRNKVQEEWTGGKTPVVVATNAFGMGIDKPNVRFVFHLGFPDNIESYYQEAGRAGRDGKRSLAAIISNRADQKLAEERIERNKPEFDIAKLTYEKLCNYIQVPENSGKGSVHPFNFYEFTEKFNLKPFEAQKSIKLLQQEGYLTINNENFKGPRLKFKANYEEVYRFQIEDPKYEPLIKTLLRSFSGLFEAYSEVNEFFLRDRLNLSESALQLLFKDLLHKDIIDYIPRAENTTVTLLSPRIPAKNLLFDRKKYNKLHKNYALKMGQMIEYVFEGEKCKSNFILRYFGQDYSTECSHCDHCIKQKRLEQEDESFREIRQKILKLLKEEKNIDNNSILLRLREYNKSRITEVMRWMISEGELESN